MVRDRTAPARKLKRAQILLAADAGSTDAQIAKSLEVGFSTVYRTKQRFLEEGLERALSEAPRAGADPKFDASDKALLIAVVGSKPPSGSARWTLRLLADEMVRLTTHESISEETIRRRLNELDLKPWNETVPNVSTLDAELAAGTQDAVTPLPEPDDQRTPVVCVDEPPRQLVGEAPTPIPAEPGLALVTNTSTSTTTPQTSSRSSTPTR
jgi:transposase